MSRKAIILDGGKNNLKALYLVDGVLKDKLMFPSISKPITLIENEEVVSENSFIVNLNDEYFKVGEGVYADYNFEKTKLNDHTKLLFHSVLNYFCEAIDNVDFVFTCPSSDYANKQFREEMISFLKESGKLHINVNNMKQTICIDDVQIYSEGMALRQRMLLSKKFKQFHILDMGGLNTNYKLFDDKGNLIESISLDNAGSNQLVAFLKADFRRSMPYGTRININSIDYEKCIETMNFPYPTNASNFLYNNIKNFININILNKLKQLAIDLDETGVPIIFTGGTSILLKPYLQEIIQNRDKIFSPIPLWDNCVSAGTKYIMKLPISKPEKISLMNALFEEKNYGN